MAHRFEKRFAVAAPRARVWDWLEDPDTFIRGQVFPYRVEFARPAPGEPTGFQVGGLDIHHGPQNFFWSRFPRWMSRSVGAA